MKPAYLGFVMVGYSTIRRIKLWDRRDMDAWLLCECRKPPFRRTLIVMDDRGNELLFAELGLPDAL